MGLSLCRKMPQCDHYVFPNGVAKLIVTGVPSVAQQLAGTTGLSEHKAQGALSLILRQSQLIFFWISDEMYRWIPEHVTKKGRWNFNTLVCCWFHVSSKLNQQLPNSSLVVCLASSARWAGVIPQQKNRPAGRVLPAVQNQNPPSRKRPVKRAIFLFNR